MLRYPSTPVFLDGKLFLNLDGIRAEIKKVTIPTEDCDEAEVRLTIWTVPSTFVECFNH